MNFAGQNLVRFLDCLICDNVEGDRYAA